MSELIDKVIDEGAIKKQLDTLDAQLTKSANNLAACAIQAKAFSDAFGSSKGINDITAMLKAYNDTVTASQKAQNDMVNQQKQRVDIDLKLQKAQESNAKTELLNAQAIAATQKAQEAATKAEQARIDTISRSIAQVEKSLKAETELRSAKQEMINILTREGVSVDKMSMSKNQALTINRLILAANSAEIGSREQLSAQFDLNYKAFSKLSSAQQNTASGKAFQASILEQSNALKGVEGKMGVFTRDMGNYSSATKMMGINLSQILKEMPNFAISARIGIMSLSNNLPMLAESIQQVREEQKLLTAAFKAGETDVKPASMFSLISKSIFGLTGSMVLIMTLLQLFGPQMIKWVADLLRGENAVRSLTSKLYELNTAEQTIHKTMKDGGGVYAEAVKSVEQMNVQLAAAKGNHDEEVLALDKYNKGLGENFGKATSVGQALDIIASKKDAYIDAMMQMAYANAFLAQSQKDMVSYVDVQTKSQQEILRNSGADAKKMYENWENYDKRIKELKKSGKNYEGGETIVSPTGGIIQGEKISLQELETLRNTAAKKITSIELKERKQQLDDIKKHQGTMSDKYKEYYELYLKELEAAGIKSGSIQEKQNKIYHDAQIKEFEWAIAMQESLAKTMQDSQEKDIAAFNVVIDKKKEKVDQYIEDLKKQQSKIQETLNQTKDPKVKAQAQEDFNKVSTQITNSETKKTELFLQYELERQKGIDDIKSKWFQKYVNEEKSFQEANLKSSQDYGNKSLSYQQHIARTLLDIQQMADEKLARSRYLNGEIRITALNTVLENIKAQRAALEQSQKDAYRNDELSRSLAIAKQTSDKEIQIVADKYAKGKINATKYENELKKIFEEGSIERLNVEIWEIENTLKSEKLGNDERIKLQQELDGKKAEKASQVNDKKLQKEKELQKKIVDLIKTTAQAIQKIGDDQFQAELDRISALKTANSDAATAEKDEIQKKLDSGILSKEEADAQSKAIDDQKAARDKKLAADELEMKQKQAIFDKEMALFNIGINTAEAIILNTAQLGFVPAIPVNILQLALGAVEATAVLAKPLPAYALGTEDHPGGPALVGEVQPEMIKTPDNKIAKVDKPTIMNLPAHTKVFPDYDKALQQMAFDASIRSMYASIPSIEINAYNDALMRSHMRNLSAKTDKQINELGRLRGIDKHMENMVNTNQKIEKAINSLRKNPWVN